jgi:antitoxin PrlF
LYSAKVTSKGQVTIPKELRKKIGIDTGSYIEIRETEMGYVISKQVKEDCLKKYIGILDNENSSDSIVKEMRGD